MTEDQIVEAFRLKHQEKLSNRKIAKHLGVGKSTIGDLFTGSTHKGVVDRYKLFSNNSQVLSPAKKRKKLEGKKFVFTSAQNNTFVHEKFLNSLKQYCDYNDAELIVGTFYYNKNGFQKGGVDGDWFDPKIKSYILNESREVFRDLLWCGELNILPTAVNPLTGYHSYTQRSSGIIPHVKMQLESLAGHKEDGARFLYTTGTVTQRNYIDMSAGQKASFHHVFGAVVAELDEDGDWFVRQLIAESETGCFYDLDKYYTPTGVEVSNEIEAINYGDIHAAKIDPEVARCSWESSNSLLDVLRPRYQFLHDIYDHKYRNHHNIGDPYFLYEMFINGTQSVKDELELTAELMEGMQRLYSQVVVVESNHDLALKRWLKEQDYKRDPINAEIFLELQLATYQAIRERKDFSVFEYACKLVNKHIDDIKFLRTDESFRICGDIECGSHGHNGNNGARGSISAFQKLGVRSNTGHSHCLTHHHSVNIQDKGWVNIEDVCVGDVVSTLNKEGRNEFVEVLNTIHGSYTGTLIKLRSRGVQQTITDKHNLYLKDGSYMNVMEAVVKRHSSEVPVVALECDSYEDYPISDVDLRKLVAFCADGHFFRPTRTMRFHLKKERKIREVEELFGDDITGFRVQRTGASKTTIKVGSPSFSMLMGLMPEKKVLPSFLYKLSNRQIRVFLSELIKWDGTFDTGSNSNQFSTVKQDEAFLVSSLIHKIGHRVTVKLRSPSDPTKATWHISWCDVNDCYNHTASTHDKERLGSWGVVTKSVVDEPVYCLTTENSNFWVRDNISGKVSLTGNSAAIKDGAYAAGVSGKLDMGYNVGGSSWSQSHILTYKNGKRTIVTIRNGKWRSNVK